MRTIDYPGYGRANESTTDKLERGNVEEVDDEQHNVDDDDDKVEACK